MNLEKQQVEQHDGSQSRDALVHAAFGSDKEQISPDGKADVKVESSDSADVLRRAMLHKAAIDNQVQVSQVGDKTVLSIQVAGKEREIFSTTESGIDSSRIARITADLVEAKERQLQEKYKAFFAKGGEEAVGKLSFNDEGQPVHGKMVLARAPHLAELYELERVLAQAAPSHLARNNKEGLKFYFLSESMYEPNFDNGAVATYTARDKNNKPAVYFSDTMAAVLKDSQSKDSQGMTWQGGTDLHMLVHELAHNSQNRMGLDREKTLIAYSHGCGFYPFNPPGSEATVWAIKSKDGALYRRDREVDAWVRINEKNETLDKDNKPVEPKLAQSYDDVQMRNNALVRPPTLYFDNAAEMGAEGMALFRESLDGRRELLRESPKFYEFIKAQDQRELDLAYGKNHGRSNKVRLPDGSVVRNDGAARKRINDMEKEAADGNH